MILHQYRNKHKFAVASNRERLVCKSYTIVKMEEQVTLSENLLKVTLTCELLLKAGQSHDSRLGLKQRFFIERHSIEVEKWCQNIFTIFVTLWLNICNNNDQTWFFNALTFARSLRLDFQ